MNQETVESMVTHLVQCSCNGFVDHPKGFAKAPAAAKAPPFKPDQARSPMKWNSILKDLLARCPHFCRDEQVLPKPANAPRWREKPSRKVLAPLGLKHNTENIIAGSLDMSRKRKADASIWAPAKRVKVDDSLKPCSVVIKRASLQVLLLRYKCVNNRPFVRLYDITKEIPQVKEEVKPLVQTEFMGLLGLDSKSPSCGKQCPEIKASHPVKLTSHPQIPFSSDYGRRLLLRERHYLPQEVALRKIERTEWYLKGAAALGRSNQPPEVSYDSRRSKYTHTYNFPKRQYHQSHQSLQQAFNKYLCKPVCVRLEIMDLSSRVSTTMQRPVAPSVGGGINEPKENDIFASKTVPTKAKQEVLTIECAKLSDADLRPRSNAFAKAKLVSKPRRSLRLNHTNCNDFLL